MPETPVTLALRSGNREAGIVLSKDGRASPEPLKKGTVLDLTRYGRPAPAPYDAETRYDRQFLMLLDQIYVGNYNGKTAQLWAINGEVFPNVPTFMVREGEIVKTTIVNRSFAPHPMHLHGHHIHVVSKNGKPLEGSPLVLDTLLIEPGETYEVAFTANNPGLWMDHCHNLEHAASGMTMHLAYQNVVSPYSIGGEHGNHPE
jgi:FtsP/CotA-like multicopper oxidase with cupredoxin domain